MLISWLFVPGSRDNHLKKADKLPADALIFDLEDSVALQEKDKARLNVSNVLQSTGHHHPFVRVNPMESDFFMDDVWDVATSNLKGILLPKTDDRDDVVIADYVLSCVEKKKGLNAGSISIVPIIETARGIQQIDDVATASARVERLAFGAEDLKLEIGMEVANHAEELLYARSRIVAASKAASIAPPIDAVYSDFKNKDALKKAAKSGKQIGFGGKLLIHPEQIEPVEDVYTPSSEDVKEAEKIAAAYDEALKQGDAAIQVDGKMVDVPVAERAKRILSIKKNMEDR